MDSTDGVRAKLAHREPLNLDRCPAFGSGHSIALWTAPRKMYDQGDDRDDQEKVNQASRDVECDPTKDPCDKKDNK